LPKEVVRPPQIGQGGGSVGFGGGPATPKRPKTKTKQKKLGVLGVAGPPSKALSHSQIGRMGWLKPPADRS
jgi:hypothetical protein